MADGQMLVTLDEALALVLKSARTLESEPVELAQAAGRVLAQDVTSDVDLPPFNKAAMDGYACRRADLDRELAVVETIPAGYLPRQRIDVGQCARIMTGAMVPEGADCVIMVEQTEPATPAPRPADPIGPSAVRFTGAQTKDNICPRGEDVRAGQVVLRRGLRIKPPDIATAAAVGCVRPRVFRTPRVAVISTGDELVPPGDKPQTSQIRDSNSEQLCAQVRQTGATARNYGIVADRPDEIEAVVRRALGDNDLVLLSGGVSAGDYDYVPPILRQIGVNVLFHKVAIKPGKPTLFGVSERASCFGLPGNPVSSFVIFELLVRPFLYRMMGHDYRPLCVPLPLAVPVQRGKTQRQSWIPVAITAAATVEPVDCHGVAHIAALSGADGLIPLEVGTARLEPGATVMVRLLG